MILFLHEHLPQLLPDARERFDNFKDLLCGYANGESTYESFVARVKRQSCGEPEDFPGPEFDPDPFF
jgi:hypothetical protein